MTKDFFQINVREVVRSKAPKYYKKIPGFIFSWFEKFIHQKDINSIISKDYNAKGVDLMENARKYFNISLNVIGEENIPSFDNKCIFVSNHPLGGLDGICLSAYLGNKFDKKIYYLVNDILYFIEPLRPIFAPINKHGAQSRSGVQAINDSFASENQVITFPAGLNSRKINGKIIDLEWKKMFIVKAVEFQRDIVPIYFDAKNSNLFYNISNFRKKLGIKFNIEMLFLPREMFKDKNKTFNIYIGKPIPWQTFDNSKSPQQWADWVKQLVYTKDELPWKQ